nr:carboxypeptidase regulatory-like domain-containing protein [Microbacterium thalassium]
MWGARERVEGVTEAALALAEGQPSAGAPSDGVLRGSVVDAQGAPAANVAVSAFAVTAEESGRLFEHVATVRTDSSGAYGFGEPPSGAYDLFFHPIDAPDLAWGWLGGGIEPSVDAPVQVAVGPVELGVHALTPAAQIQGTVTNEYSGGPLSGIEVTVWGGDGVDPGTGVETFSRVGRQTTDAGAYAFAQLPPGSYILEYTSPSPSFVGEWWNHTQSFEAASALRLAAGDIVAADAELRPRVDLGTVSISGTPTVGITLKATHKTASTSSYAYQWYADDAAIAGAKSATLKLTSAHEHKRITVRVTGTNPHALSSSAISASTPKVMLTTTIKITGKRAIAQDVYSEYTRYTLSVARGTWTSGATVTYQWYADGAAISGANGTSYTLRVDDVGKRITVKVTAKKDGYATVTRTAPTTTRIAQIGTPTFMGPVYAGSPLSNYGWGDWTSGAKKTFRVYVDGTLVDSATTTGSFPKLYADIPDWAVGKPVTLTITGSLSGYTTYTASATSAPVLPRR